MAQPFVGEIRQVGFNFNPPGWFPCNGQLVSIADYSTLFTLIGTTYGGDGVQTFGIPNLQGRALIHQGQNPSGANYPMGQMAGTEQVTITSNQMAAHSHPVQANSGLANLLAPTINSTWAQINSDGATPLAAFAAAPGNVTLGGTVVSSAGSSLPIDILQPYLVINFIIAWAGIFPSQG